MWGQLPPYGLGNEEKGSTEERVGRGWGRQTTIINSKLCEILEGDRFDETTEDCNGVNDNGEEVHF